eukprot:TRINITY_DN12825_c0_g1_i1.p1 TRINITY_DN12825_c0_g1~~TRINITY_DN12825_c0_g1_i1.p1  ORF type:complete len:471 (+),score=97.01 TRINITY_DN12825_c0_g1_i1:199-1611(+)
MKVLRSREAVTSRRKYVGVLTAALVIFAFLFIWTRPSPKPAATLTIAAVDDEEADGGYCPINWDEVDAAGDGEEKEEEDAGCDGGGGGDVEAVAGDISLADTGPDDHNRIHIIIASDNAVALYATCNSILTNTAEPHNIAIHVIVPSVFQDVAIESSVQRTLSLIRSHPSGPHSVDSAPFDDTRYVPFDLHSDTLGVSRRNGVEVRSRLVSSLNFARFYIRDLYPSLDKVLWIDHDVIVLGDVRELHTLSFAPTEFHSLAIDNDERAAGEGNTLRSGERKKGDLSETFSWLAALPAHQREASPKAISAVSNCDQRIYKFVNGLRQIGYEREECSFNAGVMGIDLKEWDRLDITPKSMEIVATHIANTDRDSLDKKSRVDGTGTAVIDRDTPFPSLSFRNGMTQPPLLLLFYHDYAQLPAEWNSLGFGGRERPPSVVKKAKLIHWTGKQKPWLDEGLNKQLWEPWTTSQLG